MKILHISTSDTGGAANACIRLHLGLLELGHESKVLVFIKKRNIPEVYQLYENMTSNYFIDKYRYFKFGFHEGINRLQLLGRDKNFDIFTKPKSLLHPEQHPLFAWADIINLHWVSYFIDYRTFFRDKNKKYVWTLHDMNPFTGGCHYSLECNNFETNCITCPQLNNSLSSNLAKNNFQIKKTVFSDLKQMYIITPSKWLAQLTKQSNLFSKYEIININNGHNQNIFFPLDKNTSKSHFNLPKNKKILLFITDHFENKRKGFDKIFEAFNSLNKDNNEILCIVGSGTLEKTNENILHIGIISNENEMALLYSAADVFILPTQIDNLPNTIIESLLCGTPVIAFPVGGIPEMIINGQNGLLCNQANTESLKNTIEEFFSGKYVFNRDSIRENAVKNYGLLNQAQKYADLYHSILND